MASLVLLGRAVLPVGLFDKAMELMGVSDSMDEFKGRAAHTSAKNITNDQK